MPYELHGNCVHKVGSDKPVPGGCHKTHEEAVKHMQALNINVRDAKSAILQELATFPPSMVEGLYQKDT